MSQYIAINRFPDTWGMNARCPVCKSRTMKVIHFDSSADQLQCPVCGVSFEVEEKGEHIFFTQTPLDLEIQLKHHWVSRQELAHELGNRSQMVPSQQIPLEKGNNQPKGNPLRAEAVRRARKLVELGNSPAVVRSALSESMQLTDHAIEEIISDAVNVHKMKQKESNKKYWVIAAGAIVIVILIIFVLVLVL
jgi:ribosomal protein S27E